MARFGSHRDRKGQTMTRTKTKVAVIGTVGLPAQYGGFETLAENLAREVQTSHPEIDLVVYCSAKAYPDRPPQFEKTPLRYIALQANGLQSILYDGLALLDACRKGDQVIVVLGVSGGLFIPLAKAVWTVRIVTNIDGLEWRRAKWGGFARWFLKLSERVAVRASDDVIADNQAITDYVFSTYKRSAATIAYGGDQALADPPGDISDLDLPQSYALALCRIEPENNVHMILDAYAGLKDENLVFVGNWDGSDYGRRLRQQYGHHANIYMVDPVYAPDRLRAIRDRAGCIYPWPFRGRDKSVSGRNDAIRCAGSGL